MEVLPVKYAPVTGIAKEIIDCVGQIGPLVSP